jgi:exonuclease III
LRNFSNRSDIEDKELIIMGDLNCDLLEEDNLIILRRILRRKVQKEILDARNLPSTLFTATWFKCSNHILWFFYN